MYDIVIDPVIYIERVTRVFVDATVCPPVGFGLPVPSNADCCSARITVFRTIIMKISADVILLRIFAASCSVRRLRLPVRVC